VKPISSIISASLARLVRPAPLSDGKVQFAWRAVVGSALQRATAVRLEQGTLVVEAASREWAGEIRRSSPLILRRLQDLLGDAVTRLEVRRQ